MTAAAITRARGWFAALVADRARMRFLRLSLIWTAVAWLAVSVVVGGIARTYRVGLDFNDPRCMPWHVYLVKLKRPAIVRGEYVAYRDIDGVMGPGYSGKLLGKLVAGVPGDRVVVKGDFAWVNGAPIGALVHNAKLGREPGGFDREEIVPEGKLFVVGTEPRSYDSRYWGFLDERAVVGGLHPLF